MSKDPAVLFYTSDFLAGTSFFSDEQRGQYILLLCQQHQLGSIPENHMISVCKSHDSPVMCKFVKDSNGNYYNERMRLEHEKRVSYCASRGKNKKGHSKSKIISKSYENHMTVHMENGNEDEDKNKDIKEKNDYEQPIIYLNEKAGRNFSTKTSGNIKFVMARFKEGRTLEDFKAVIDKKVASWKGTQYENFLRPETLFNATKFESYLNETTVIKKQNPMNLNSKQQQNMEALNDFARRHNTDTRLIS